MDEKEHWNAIAPTYNEEIFDVYKNDKNLILPKYFKKHANKNLLALDFGCGNGKSLPYLSPIFKSIIGIDISSELISQAKERGFSNVEFKILDLSKKNLKLPKVDFVFCCNVIMLPKIKKNYSMFQNISKALNPEGKAVIVLPSSESAQFSTWRIIGLYQKEGVKVKDIPSSDFGYYKSTKREIALGIFHIDKVPTKHYSALELEVIFKEAGLKITNLEKVEYEWTSELLSPPDWLKAPYPWDWLVECKREK